MEPMTNNIATLEVKNNTLFVSGAIDFDNVVLSWQQGIALIDTLKDTKEIKVSQEKNKTILLMNMPGFMQDILQVCGLEGVLPVSWEN